MADRSITVRLRAEASDFKRELEAASKAATKVGDSSEAAAKRSKTALGQMVQSASKNEEAWTKVGTSLLGVGVAAAAGVGLAVTKFAEFDEAMSHVQASTHATAASMGVLREAALEAGADTQYSATEAAGAIEELAKAGVTTTDILGGGLSGALDLAAAGGLDVADAAESAATALTIFGLSGDQASHVADLLAAGAGKAQGSVQDMSMALKQTGLVADQTGLSIEETTGGLAAFASAGLLGSDAGTSFKAMLQRLTPTSKEAQKAMDDLGISAYDSQGNFIGLANFAGVLQRALKDKTTEERNSAMATIFGSDAVRAASVLYEQGADGIQDWITKVDDAGYAAETARLRTDNLRGDIERLGGAFDTALIQTGEASNGVLRSLTQSITGVVDAYGEMSPAVQNGTLIVGAATAAVALLSGGFLVLAPRILATKAAVATLKTDMPLLSKAMGGMAKAAGIAGAAYGVIQLSDAIVNLVDRSRGAITDIEAVKSIILELDAIKTANLFAVGDGIDNVTEAMDALVGSGLKQKLNQQAATLDGVFGTSFISNVKDSKAAFAAYDDSLASLVQAGYAEKAAEGLAVLYSQVDQSKYSIEDLQALLPGYAEALAGAANEQALAAEGAAGLADGVALVDPAVEAASEALLEWQKMVADSDASFVDLQGAYDAVISKSREFAEKSAADSKSTEDSWEDFYDGSAVNADEYIAQLQAQVDAQTAWETNMVDLANRANTGMTAEMEAAANGMIDELLALGPEGAAQVQLLHDMTDEQFAQVVSLWAQKGTDAVTEFTDKVEAYRQPVITPTVNPDGALTSFRNLVRQMSGATIGLNTSFGNQRPMATGGHVSGPGTGTSDSIPALLSNGEYVIKADSVAQYGRGFFDSLNAQRFATGGPVGGGVAAPRAAQQEVSAGLQFGDVTLVAADPHAALGKMRDLLRFELAGRAQ